MSSANKSSTSRASEVSRKELVADLIQISKAFPLVIPTRNFYRAHGRYSENVWQKHFSRFSDFVSAAGLAPKSVIVPPVVKPVQPTKPTETSEIAGNTWTLSLPRTRISSLEELLAHAKVDLSIWEVKSCTINQWEMISKANGVEPLFQIKAILAKRTEMVAIKSEIARLKEDAKASARTPSAIVRPFGTTGNMLEINIPDAHFGKLAWGAETMYENYDTTIAEQIYMRALNTLLERTRGYKFDQVVFVVGNDLFNSDDIEGKTTKGTIVTTDGRYHKTFWKVRRTITACIERLRKIAPVKVMMVPGNHDNLSVWHLGDSLECYFAKYDDVEIENQPTPRKYHQHGEVLLMFTHGDKGKRTDYPLLMATERRAMWGETKFRECHTGHTHMTKMDEQHGVRVRVLPALCPPDDWHSEQGFVGNLRNAEAFVWNEKEGLIAQVFYNDDSQSAITTRRELVEAA